MKRMQVLMLCLFLLMCSGTIVYGEDIDVNYDSQSENSVFAFRNGITWDSTPEQIERAENRVCDPEEFNNWFAYVYNNAQVSNFTADLHYMFSEGELLLAYYTFYRNHLSEEEYLYLTEALAYKYGHPSMPDYERLKGWRNPTYCNETRRSKENWRSC